MRTVRTEGPEQTHALGVALGRAAFPGAVIALSGDLGAGKTVLAKGIGRGLDVPTRVQSPTFVLVQAHPDGRLPLWHCDLYRIGDGAEVGNLGLDDLIGADGVVVIEWAERFPALLPGDHLAIHLDGTGDARTIALRATGPRHAVLEGVGDP